MTLRIDLTDVTLVSEDTCPKTLLMKLLRLMILLEMMLEVVMGVVYMEVDKVANEVADMVVHMKVDKVANMLVKIPDEDY